MDRREILLLGISAIPLAFSGAMIGATHMANVNHPINIRIGRISHILAPGYSWCFRCLTNWAFVEGHSTRFNASQGCFPLCKKCWAELTPIQRIPYYDQLADMWERTTPDWSDREAIHKAVMAGL